MKQALISCDTQGAKAAAVAPLPLRFQPLVHLYIQAFIQPYDSISQPCCIMYMTILHVELASGWMVPWAKANSDPTVRPALIISTVPGMTYFIAADKKSRRS
ncbi:hypothetical protein BS78_02G077700 [Paspalum vaginatum]|nr:hypothetical protein BS78_02G077700 [Paspalum vaginatum]KAJ1288269.1 hypothetical protein BS78_02G077700 [Paspalum vaginatum]